MIRAKQITLALLLPVISLLLAVGLLDGQIGPTAALANPAPQQRYAGPVALIEAAQTLSTTWVDLGNEIDTERYDHVGLWVSLTISDSTNARVRALVKHTFGVTAEYVLPIETVGTSDIAVEDEYIEFNDDADQDVLLTWDLDNVIPVVQFQIQAGAVGTTAGRIDTAHITRGY